MNNHNTNIVADYRDENWFEEAGVRIRKRMEAQQLELIKLAKVLNKNLDSDEYNEYSELSKAKLVREIDHYEKHIKMIKEHIGKIIDQLEDHQTLMLAFLKGINTNNPNYDA